MYIYNKCNNCNEKQEPSKPISLETVRQEPVNEQSIKQDTQLHVNSTKVQKQETKTIRSIPANSCAGRGLVRVHE